MAADDTARLNEIKDRRRQAMLGGDTQEAIRATLDKAVVLGLLTRDDVAEILDT